MGREAEGLNRRILRLALPTLGAFIAEPLFLATDTALVGHLGATPLAALSIAGSVISTVVGLVIFLAYATTPIVGRRFGAGDLRGAAQAGVDGVWIAIGLGAILVAALEPCAGLIAAAYGTPAPLTESVASYLAVAVLGIPAMLVVLAATGMLRGLQDARTPLWIAVAGFAANAALNAILIYPAGLGLIGSAIGTTIAQWGMAIASLVIVVVHARRRGARLLPGRDGILGTLQLGGWLLLRTVSLRILFFAMTAAAVPHGETTVAAMAIVMTVLGFLAFALDALAIAGQALISEELGRGSAEGARIVFGRLMRLSVASGLVLGAAVAALCWPIAAIFTSDAGVLGAAWPGLLVVAVGIPLGGAVYALDGILIGAGDARFLARAGLINLAVTGPALLAIALVPLTPLWAVLLMQGAWSILSMLARLVPLGLRARGDRWLRVAA